MSRERRLQPGQHRCRRHRPSLFARLGVEGMQQPIVGVGVEHGRTARDRLGEGPVGHAEIELRVGCTHNLGRRMEDVAQPALAVVCCGNPRAGQRDACRQEHLQRRPIVCVLPEFADGLPEGPVCHQLRFGGVGHIEQSIVRRGLRHHVAKLRETGIGHRTLFRQRDAEPLHAVRQVSTCCRGRHVGARQPRRRAGRDDFSIGHAVGPVRQRAPDEAVGIGKEALAIRKRAAMHLGLGRVEFAVGTKLRRVEPIQPGREEDARAKVLLQRRPRAAELPPHHLARPVGRVGMHRRGCQHVVGADGPGAAILRRPRRRQRRNPRRLARQDRAQHRAQLKPELVLRVGDEGLATRLVRLRDRIKDKPRARHIEGHHVEVDAHVGEVGCIGRRLVVPVALTTRLSLPRPRRTSTRIARFKGILAIGDQDDVAVSAIHQRVRLAERVVAGVGAADACRGRRACVKPDRIFQHRSDGRGPVGDRR